MFERMLSYPNIKLMLNTDFKEIMRIDPETKKIYFVGQGSKGMVFFTGQIDELFDYKYRVLDYRSLRFEFKVVDKECYQSVDYPNNYDFTRI